MKKVIQIEKHVLPNGDSIPKLKNKKDKIIIINNDDEVEWEYLGKDQDNVVVTIEAMESFNGKKGGEKASSHSGKVKVKFGGAKVGQDRYLAYDIGTDKTNTLLDPMIVIKGKGNIYNLILNPFFTAVTGFILGLVLAHLLG